MELNLNRQQILRMIDDALAEDIGTGDLTTEAVVDSTQQVQGELIAKEEGVIAGLAVAGLIFERLGAKIDYQQQIEEGVRVRPQTVIATISGLAAPILTGERVALNFLQRLSGIATKTAQYAELVADYDVRIVDTRKTTPGLRMLEKYAVRVGGGFNHRCGLYDAVLIKDNHIQVVGSITEAVEQAKEGVPHTVKIEVEVETLAEVKEALASGVDIIMLDNMPPELMEKAVGLIAGQTVTEASGGITAETIKEVAQAGVDIISLGTLTHTISALDISLRLGSDNNDRPKG
ncbi:carboxylating nicotinate-nucleotide diphosphorylase [Acetohalobium arabaticum]|uniref:Probable nicotinate-nucleotide pyrophosphorylase [carboxylating] n=1 Tax=Acetohalobium arabaticum (strain ATCC 49924 / DSM 5501 / Z-7288) TaxID=574087 RepID=D9QQ14_ACEAZ|nr:carboxylating nicotinate-nucleotide diphosphorylase [Acetohalobium arabaticum]ADL12605.1 nicotinate-nucleotide pyrophosphorylase (carboxylating) [Acetohalobium arabaticum DSM 5501]